MSGHGGNNSLGFLIPTILILILLFSSLPSYTNYSEIAVIDSTVLYSDYDVNQSEPKVLIIGVDGVRADVAQNSSLRDGSAFGRIKAEGAWSFNSTVGPISISGPSWSSMLTGVWCDRHGVVDNTFEGSQHDDIPDVIERIESNNQTSKTAAIMYWSGIDEEILGKNTADIQERYETDDEISTRAIELLKEEEDLDLLFLNMDSPDNNGHEFGFSPDIPEYVDAVEAADDRVATILTALDERNKSGEDWLVIITSDHGGGGKSIRAHSPSTLVDRTTFMLVMGGDTVPKEITNNPVVVDVAVTALTHMKIALPTGENELDGRAAAFDPNAPLAREAHCIRPEKEESNAIYIVMSVLSSIVGVCIFGLYIYASRIINRNKKTLQEMQSTQLENVHSQDSPDHLT